jgi:hypothetical protein
MSTNATIDPLTEVLQRLEAQLELPHVSGELSSWSSEVLRLMREAEAQTRTAVAREFPTAYETIVKRQRNLSTQVDKLRADDEALLATMEAVLRQAEQFDASIDETVLAEQQFHPKRERLINDGLSFVLRVRRQQAAVATWLGEALQRDNGVGD